MRSAPLRLKLNPAPVVCGDALDLIPALPNRSVNLCLTSPPYCQQRQRQYGGVSETDYPAWMRRAMAALKPKLTADGSVLIVIRPHLRDGVVSDYVLRTRLALRDDGWKENEELIWLKPDAAFFGSKLRLRRNFEHILWFSTVKNPYIDLTATGTFSDRLGFQSAHRFRNHDNPIATKRSSKLAIGRARGSDVFVAPVGDIEEGIMHPAMFPVSLCEKLIRTFSREGDVVLDPFAGSGTALLAAQSLGRKYVGFDLDPKFVQMAKSRLLASSAASGSGVRLHPDFPQTAKERRAFVLAKGLNDSDVRVFNLIVERTAMSQQPSVALSLSDIAELTGFCRRTAIRSVQRLREEGLIQTVIDDDFRRHRSSLIGLSAKFVLPVVGNKSGDFRRRKVTSSVQAVEGNVRKKIAG